MLNARTASRCADRGYNRHTRNLSIGTLVETLTISPKYQVVIPKRIRGMLKLSPGQKLQAILFEDRIELIPLRTAKTVRGFLRGIDTDVPREGDRI